MKKKRVKRRKKYVRPFPNNKALEPLEKKIGYSFSIKRKVVIAFINTCEELGISKNKMCEQLLSDFVGQIIMTKKIEDGKDHKDRIG